MKRILLAGATLLALTTAQPTLAADAPVYRKAPPPAAALFNWSGFYIGGHVGYAWGQSRTEALGPDALDCGGIGTCPEFLSHSTSGAFGGLHLGHNWQFNSTVFGIEIEGGYLGARGSAFSPAVPDHFFSAQYGAYGALTARLGVVMNQTTLLYLKGGGVVAQIKREALDDLPGPPDPDHSISESRARFGWTIGGGIEHAFANNWTVRVEYLYMHFLRRTAFDIGDGGGLGGAPSPYNFDDYLHTVRLGLSYKF